jgi:hypothetical protein
MGSVCRCLIQYCCNRHSSNENDTDADEHDDDNDRPVRRRPSYSSVSDYMNPIEGQGLISNRGEQQQQQQQLDRRNATNVVVVVAGESSTTLTSTSSSHALNEEDDTHNSNNSTTTCCRPSSSDPNHTSFFDTIRRRMNRWNHNQYNAVVTVNDVYRHHFSTNTTTTKDGRLLAPSPLRQAMSFTATNDANHLCTIHADEIVLPGSMIQQQMAEQMILTGTYNNNATMVDECVICMEPFDSTNPRMPTLCHCGTNKTYFHLPCLYQWIEQSENCPSCRTKITWEEF